VEAIHARIEITRINVFNLRSSYFGSRNGIVCLLEYQKSQIVFPFSFSFINKFSIATLFGLWSTSFSSRQNTRYIQ
jgi:hypothetical protein